MMKKAGHESTFFCFREFVGTDTSGCNRKSADHVSQISEEDSIREHGQPYDHIIAFKRISVSTLTLVFFRTYPRFISYESS